MRRVREVGGQQVYEKPWHCAFCRRRYTRRHLIEVWEQERTRGGELVLMKRAVRICATTPESRGRGVIVGCFEMGLARLLREVQRPRRGQLRLRRAA